MYSLKKDQFCIYVVSACLLAAEDWLKPDVVLEVFEGRAARMSAACAQKLVVEFSNLEEGMLLLSCT